jgi:CubicO group peptidase (beta-lactamase class C family)
VAVAAAGVSVLNCAPKARRRGPTWCGCCGCGSTSSSPSVFGFLWRVRLRRAAGAGGTASASECVAGVLSTGVADGVSRGARGRRGGRGRRFSPPATVWELLSPAVAASPPTSPPSGFLFRGLRGRHRRLCSPPACGGGGGGPSIIAVVLESSLFVVGCGGSGGGEEIRDERC